MSTKATSKSRTTKAPVMKKVEDTPQVEAVEIPEAVMVDLRTYQKLATEATQTAYGVVSIFMKSTGLDPAEYSFNFSTLELTKK